MPKEILEVVSTFKWKLEMLKAYYRSDFFNVTPYFPIQEITSRRAKMQHFSAFETYESEKWLKSLSPEKFIDIEESI